MSTGITTEALVAAMRMVEDWEVAGAAWCNEEMFSALCVFVLASLAYEKAELEASALPFARDMFELHRAPLPIQARRADALAAYRDALAALCARSDSHGPRP